MRFDILRMKFFFNEIIVMKSLKGYFKVRTVLSQNAPENVSYFILILETSNFKYVL